MALKGQQLVKQLQKYVTSAECNAITSNMLPNMKLSSIKLNIIHIQAYMTLILGFIALIFQFSCHFGAISYLNISSTSDECGRVRGGSLCVWMKSSLLLHAHTHIHIFSLKLICLSRCNIFRASAVLSVLKSLDVYVGAAAVCTYYCHRLIGIKEKKQTKLQLSAR